MGDYPVRVTQRRTDVVRIEALSTRRGLDFGGMARVSKRMKEASDDTLSPEAQGALGAPLAWLFLIELRPRRARLRFTKHNKHRTSARVVLEKNQNRALTRGRLWVTPFSLFCFLTRLVAAVK